MSLIAAADQRWVKQDDTALATWLGERCGLLTASRMADAMAYLKDGKTPAQKRTDYMRELLAERLTQINMRHYVSPAMEHGLEQEPFAKAIYTLRTGTKIKDSHFYKHPAIDNFGATPDGETGDDTLFEVKCPTTPKFVSWVMAGVVPDEHKPQMLAQIAVTRRARVIFIAFDPRITEEDKRLFIREYVPTIAEVEKVEAEARKFLEELDQAWEAFVTA